MQIKQDIEFIAERLDKNGLQMMDSVEGMKLFLEDYNFVKDETLTLKGRVAR